MKLWDKIVAAMGAMVQSWVGGPQIWLDDDLTPQEKERRSFYDKAWTYYRGHHKQPLKVLSGQPNDNVILNYSRRVVDKGVAFLFGKQLIWELPLLTERSDDAEETESPAELALREVWESEEAMMMFLTDMATTGGVCGTFYLQIVIKQDETLRLVALDPYLVLPKFDPDDVDDIWAYHLRWRVGDTARRQVWVRDSLLNEETDMEEPDEEGFWSYWTEEKDSRGVWRLVVEAEIWPYPFAPFIHGKNLPNPHSFYGRSDLEDADLNDTINFVAGNTNRLIRKCAHPLIWGYGFQRGEMRISPGSAVISTNPDAKLAAMQQIGEVKVASTFLDRMISAYSQITCTPDLDPSNMRLGAASGFALRVLYGDLLEKTCLKRSSYGAALIETLRRCAFILGYGEDQRVKLTWEDPLPVDERQEVEGLGFDATQGLASKETLATKRGYDWEEEQKRKKKEGESDDNVGLALLDAFKTGHRGVADQENED